MKNEILNIVEKFVWSEIRKILKDKKYIILSYFEK